MFYSCESVSDFLGNDAQKKDFYSFLSSDANRVVVIVGGSGYGKTTFCESIFRDPQFSKRFSFIRPIYEHLPTHKEFIHFVETSINTFSILNFSQRNKLLFLDDVDILFSMDRQACKYVLDLVKNLKNTPHLRIVITCSMSEEKRLSDIKKKGVPIIRLETPPLDKCTEAIFKYVADLRWQKHLYNEKNGQKQNIRIKVNRCERERISSLVKVLECNMRSIIAHIDEVINLYPLESEKVKMKKQDSDQHIKQRVISTTYANMNILDLAQNLLCHSHQGVSELVVPLSSDPNLLSMILYENLVPFLLKNYAIHMPILLPKLKKIYKAFIMGSIIESGVYKNASWENVNLEWLHLYKCGLIRDLQNTMGNTKKTEKHKLNYTSILVRSTQHFCNTRRWIKWASQNDIDHIHVIRLCEISEELCSKPFESVSDEGFMHASYVKNVKDKHCFLKFYDKRLVRKKGLLI